MKLEVGKAYRTRGGEKVIINSHYLRQDMIIGYKGTGELCGTDTWTSSGRYFFSGDMESQLDLIAEWDEPRSFTKEADDNASKAFDSALAANSKQIYPFVPEVKTLRDEFIISIFPVCVVHAFSQNRNPDGESFGQNIDTLGSIAAKWSVSFADAMMKERGTK